MTTGPGGRALAAPVSELPPGWEEFFSEEHGRPYYYHDATKKTVWQRPGGAPSPGPSRARPLPTVPPTQEALPAVPNRNGFGAGQDAPPLPNRMSSDLGSRLPARQQASLPVQPEPPARGRCKSISSSNFLLACFVSFNCLPQQGQASMGDLAPSRQTFSNTSTDSFEKASCVGNNE